MSLLDNVTVIYDTTTRHRLTVARDGKIRIKVAKDTPVSDAEYIIAGLINVAEQALALNVGKTLRGAVTQTGIKYQSVTLYTDSKKVCHSFSW